MKNKYFFRVAYKFSGVLEFAFGLMAIVSLINIEIQSQTPEWLVYDSLNSPLTTNQVLDIKHDKNNIIWIGTNYGLFKFDGYFWRLYNTENSGIPYNDISGIVNDRHNNLWFVTRPTDYPYFIKFDGKNWIKTDTAQTCIKSTYAGGKCNFAVDGNGVKWIIGYNPDIYPYTTIFRLSGDSCSVFNPGIAPEYWSILKIDHQDNFWYSTDTDYDHTGFAKHTNSGWILNRDWTYSFALDTVYNEVWKPSVSNFSKYNFSTLNRIIYYSLPNNNDIVYRIYPDANYNLWISTYGSAVYKFDRSSEMFTYYSNLNSGLPSDRVEAIAIDDQSNVWFASDSGLAVLNESGIDLPPSISNKDTLDFGKTLLSDTTSLSFIITNSFQTDIVIDSITNYPNVFDCNYSSSIIIQPGQFKEFTAHFIPDSLVKYKSKIILNTNRGMKSIMLLGEGTDPTSVQKTKNELNEFRLFQNYPNPFNPTTKIEFRITEGGLVTLIVYDVLGNEVATLINEEKPAGEYEIEFNASSFPSGVYFYQLKTGRFIDTKKTILLK